jgi:5-methylthioadenosine/S-adenosylhomocysteine deaminase
MSGAPATPLTVTGASSAGATVGVRCEAARIAEIGAAVAPRSGDLVIDAGGAPLVPALVNGHTHAAMTLFRGRGGDLPLMRWLQERIWPVEAKLEPEDVYWGVRLACVEMIRTGTARFWDMYWHPEATARAVRDAGLRATIGAPLIESGGAAVGLREAALESLEPLADFGDEAAPALAPHAIYTVGEDSLRWVGELAGERGLPVHIHLSETREEVEDCLREHGRRPAAYLDDLGLLGERTLLAHGVWLDDEELELIGARGATVVSNPAANMKLAVGGTFPYPAARAAGVRVGLGTDGPGSNDSLDLISEVKLFALTQKQLAGDSAAVTAAEVLEVACGARSPLLGGSASLEVGDPADFLLLRRDAPEMSIGDLASDLVYAASGSVVDTTVVGGRVLMRDGVVEGSAEVVAKARERAARLGLA